MKVLLQKEPDYYEGNNQNLVVDAISSLEKAIKFDDDFNNSIPMLPKGCWDVAEDIDKAIEEGLANAKEAN